MKAGNYASGLLAVYQASRLSACHGCQCHPRYLHVRYLTYSLGILSALKSYVAATGQLKLLKGPLFAASGIGKIKSQPATKKNIYMIHAQLKKRSSMQIIYLIG